MVGLGANLDRRRARFLAARGILFLLLDDAVASSVYLTDPVGIVDQPRFWNAAIAGLTLAEPQELLRALKEIERALGRRNCELRDGPREIDLDLLVLGDTVVTSDAVTVPHPRLLERPFALTPAAEVAPDFRHPLVGASLARLAAAAPRPSPIAGPSSWETLARVL